MSEAPVPLSDIVKVQIMDYVKDLISRDATSRDPFMLWQRLVIVAAGLEVDERPPNKEEVRANQILEAATRFSAQLCADADIAKYALPVGYTKEDLLMTNKPERFVPKSRQSTTQNAPLEAKVMLDRYKKYCADVLDLSAKWFKQLPGGVFPSGKSVSDILQIILEKQGTGTDSSGKVSLPHAWIPFVVFGPPAGKNVAQKFSSSAESVYSEDAKDKRQKLNRVNQRQGEKRPRSESVDDEGDDDVVDLASASASTAKKDSTEVLDCSPLSVSEGDASVASRLANSLDDVSRALRTTMNKEMDSFNKGSDFDRLKGALKEVIADDLSSPSAEFNKNKAKKMLRKLNFAYIKSQSGNDGWLQGEDAQFLGDDAP